MGKRARKNIVCLSLFILWTGSAGCATPEDPLGAEIRQSLGVTKRSAEETKDALERNYDPKVILKRAEALYQQGDYIEAAGEYQHFLDLHPLHEWADYAQLKSGLSHFRQFTTIDRDPEPVQKAMDSFQKLLTTYPNTRYADEAKKGIEICRERLSRHQFYVGHFYFKQAAYPAAIYRLQQILTSYPNEPVVEDALYYLALSYAGEGKAGEASSRLEDLLIRYPHSPYQDKVRRLLARLNGQPEP